MAAFCLLALIVGAFSTSALAIVPFAIGLMIASVVGIGLACVVAPSIHAALLGGLALFVAAQVGYGIGLGCRGMIGRRRKGNLATGLTDPHLNPTFRRLKTEE